MAENIYSLIGQAMRKIGAIGKTSKNAQQGFMYRGIDAVYNALNPVMAELGLFICPEVLDQKREERTTKNGTVLIYTMLTMKYTVYAPDGSNVSVVVVGEGMDSGDKSANKAMSVAMKYAMFQLFFIPTEDLVDPDRDYHSDVLPRGQKPAAEAQKIPAQAAPKNQRFGPKSGAVVTTAEKVPENVPEKAPEAKLSPEMEYLNNELSFMAEAKNSTLTSMKTIFLINQKAGVKQGKLPEKKVSEYNMDEIKAAIAYMQQNLEGEGAA